MARDYFRLEKGIHILTANAETGVKVLFGSGAPAIEAEIGSMYLRTDVAEVYKKIDTGTDASDWELMADAGNVSALQGHIDNLVTLSGVALDATTLGTFAGSTIADSSTIKAALQALESALELVVARGSQTAITTAEILDSVLVDDVKAVVWDVWASLDSAPEQVKMFTVSAIHNGTASADATACDDSIYGKLNIGAAFDCQATVELNGATTSQVMRLSIAASAAITAKSVRRSVY